MFFVLEWPQKYEFSGPNEYEFPEPKEYEFPGPKEYEFPEPKKGSLTNPKMFKQMTCGKLCKMLRKSKNEKKHMEGKPKDINNQ